MKIAVIGAGPAGLFFSALASKEHEVHVFERGPRAGRKLLLTGAGRCNLTNIGENFIGKIYQGKFLYGALQSFGPQETMQWFEKQGLKLKTEAERVFPTSEKASDVLNTLLKACQDARFHLNSQVLEIREQEIFIDHWEHFDQIVFASGGKSYPGTGSDGSMLGLLERIGLKVNPFRPNLVGLVTGEDTAPLAGISLPVTIEKRSGDLLFTHKGISGPLLLELSSQWIDRPMPFSIRLDLLPAVTEESLLNKIFLEKQEPKRILKSLPKRLAEHLLEPFEGLELQNLKKADRKRLIGRIKAYELTVTDRLDFDTAIVSRGGVELTEIDPRTMKAKRFPWLSCIGEVLDLDGLSGGYNLQIAFTTAHQAAKALHEQ